MCPFMGVAVSVVLTVLIVIVIKITFSSWTYDVIIILCRLFCFEIAITVCIVEKTKLKQ